MYFRFCDCSGEDDQEDCVEDGVHRMQVPQTAANQALQTLRTRRRQEEKGKSCYSISKLIYLYLITVA